MSRQNLNTSAVTNNPPNREGGKIEGLSNGIIKPEFEWCGVPGQARQMLIRGRQSGSGDRVLRIPYRQIDGAGGVSRTIIHQAADPSLLLDLNVTGLGGRVDGSTLNASDNYFGWAFFDPFNAGNSKFVNVGITRLPSVVNATMTSGGGFGASTIMTKTGECLPFNLGSRVLIRRGTGFTGANIEYNQGIITAKAANTLTVTLDASYAGTGVGLNAALPAASTYGIIQLDQHAPNTATGELYGGYTYAYLGHLQTNAASNIEYTRQRGDWLRIPPTPGFYQVNTIVIVGAGNTTSITCFNRWLARNTPMAHVMVTLVNTAAGGTGFAGFLNEETTDVQVYTQRILYRNPLKWNDTLDFYLNVGGGGTKTANLYLLGWKEENF